MTSGDGTRDVSGASSSSSLVHNFAIGSNICADRLRTRGHMIGRPHGIPYVRAEPAVLRGYRIVFDTPGFPPVEPSFCSVKRCECGDGDGEHCPMVVHGTLYAFAPPEYEALWLTEGGAGGRDSNSAYVELRVRVETYAKPGVPVEATVFQTRPGKSTHALCGAWLRAVPGRRAMLRAAYERLAAVEARVFAQRGAGKGAHGDDDDDDVDELTRTMHQHVLRVVARLSCSTRAADEHALTAQYLERALVRPSLRYLLIIRDGARRAGIDERYCRYLDSVAAAPPVRWSPVLRVMQFTFAFYFVILLKDHEMHLRWQWMPRAVHMLMRAVQVTTERAFLTVPYALYAERELRALRLHQRRATREAIAAATSATAAAAADESRSGADGAMDAAARHRVRRPFAAAPSSLRGAWQQCALWYDAAVMALCTLLILLWQLPAAFCGLFVTLTARHIIRDPALARGAHEAAASAAAAATAATTTRGRISAVRRERSVDARRGIEDADEVVEAKGQ